MPFDFKKVSSKPLGNQPTDPIEVFHSIKVSDGAINDLWLAQGDALRAWHGFRTKGDVSIELNTGAGKTLVGLLIAQSLVNETKGLVLYACSSIQLVGQTEEKATGYGLPATTYVGGEFSNDLAETGKAPCLTTYHALLNGKSIFRRREVEAVIFDDAHVAEHLLRDAFTLSVGREEFKEVYELLLRTFEDYFVAVDRSATFREIAGGIPGGMLLLPPSEVKRAFEVVLGTLQDSSIPKAQSTSFAWRHLKDHLDLCAFVFSAKELTISPPFVPARTLPYFAPSVRRVYLSATLSARDVFARTFGKLPDETVSPTTTAGECERMILSPSMVEGENKPLTLAKRMIEPHKALVLVPTYQRAEQWADVAEPPEKEQVTKAIRRFKGAPAPEKLILTSRYDGVDLPGDTCRVLVVDDLPAGAGQIDRFLWEFLGMQNGLRSAIACRIAQSLGRISRGMSDHGVVVLTGRALVDWLRIRKNVAALPAFVQKQLQLGAEVSKSMTADDMAAAPAACLGRDPGWIEAYARNMRDLEAEPPGASADRATLLALAEITYAASIWRRDYAGAAKALQGTIDDALELSDATAGWHMLWAGYALDLGGDEEAAERLYRRASGLKIHLPRVRSRSGKIDVNLTEQEKAVSEAFDQDSSGRVRVPLGFERDLAWVSSDYTPAQVEESLKNLGRYLGLRSSRPDKEAGTGPDVLWIGPDGLALCVDAKSNKEEDSTYSKKEVGQLADHVEWVKAHEMVRKVVPAFAGPIVPASSKATPAPGVKAISIESLFALGERLKALYHDAAQNATPGTLPNFVHQELGRRGLDWPALLDSLHPQELRDL